jgi:hypothetical protein
MQERACPRLLAEIVTRRTQVGCHLLQLRTVKASFLANNSPIWDWVRLPIPQLGVVNPLGAASMVRVDSKLRVTVR